MKTSLLLLALIVIACSDAPQPAAKPQIAFVTNGVGPFWTIATKGVEAAAAEFAADAEVQMPGEGVADQKRIIQALLARGIDGMAISPIDPDNQTSLLNEAAARTNLLTHDSDAPKSNLFAYNPPMCLEAIKEAGKG